MQKHFPITKMTGRITMELVSSYIFCLNACPRKSVVSDKIIPSTIITGLIIECNKQLKLQFGQYVQNNESNNQSTGTARTIGALVFHLTGNYQGGYYFYSLRNGRAININRCTPLPIPDDVISLINDLDLND